MSILHYACNRKKLHPDIQKVFVQNKKSPEAKDFLRKKTRFSQIKFLLFVLMTVLQWKHYHIKGILWYETFLLSKWNVADILKQKRKKNLLDIGAWDGSITQIFREFVDEIDCIEPSVSFSKILIKRGFNIQNELVDKPHEIVTIFNVLDICEYPEKVLEKAKKNLAKDGLLIISLPFPIWTRSWDIRNIKKTNTLGQPKSTSFELSVSEFYENFLQKNNLKVIRFSRLPYLVSKPDIKEVVVYDNGLFVCKNN